MRMLMYARALRHLFYPNLCLLCQAPLPAPDAYCCLMCRARLPYTDLHCFRENAFTERFWGRVPLVYGTAMFHFTKGGQVQKLIHQLKYKGRREVGQSLGKEYGRVLHDTFSDDLPQCIVPVPLHPRKKHKRGYNQAAVIGYSLSESLHIPVAEKALRRLTNADSQTRKGRLERFQNVVAAFRLHQAEALRNNHILLVDDVLTTGATLEACALQLQQVEGVRISMATLAIASV